MNSSQSKWILLGLVVLSTNLAFGCSNWVVFGKFWKDGNAYPSLLLVMNIVAILSFLVTLVYEINPKYQIHQLLSKLFTFSLLVIFFSLIYWFSVYARQYNKEGLLIFYVFQFVFNFIFIKLWINRQRKISKGFALKNAFFFGDSDKLDQIIDSFKLNNWLGVNPMDKIPQLKYETEFLNLCKEKNIQQFYVDIDSIHWNESIENKFQVWNEEHHIAFYAISNTFSSKLKRSSYNLVDAIPVVKLYTYPLDGNYNQMLKRLFDVFFTLFAFIFIFSWLFPILGLLIIIDSGFPIFFKQKRKGSNKKEFFCFKFRTMKKNKFQDTKTTTPNDMRITKLGKHLRKLSLDELPQFYNVLKGDMSIVGPRPHMINQDEHYAKKINQYSYRHNVKPGITGYAQITGHRGHIETDQDMRNRIQADIYYIKNWAITFDMYIIYKTIFNILNGDENAI